MKVFTLPRDPISDAIRLANSSVLLSASVSDSVKKPLLLCQKDTILKNKPKTNIWFSKLPSYLVIYMCVFLCHLILGCTESVLETLTDSCHEYLLQMTKLMRLAADAEAREGASPFPVG